MDTPEDGATGGWRSMTMDYSTAWLRATEHATRSVLEAQRATLSAFGLTDREDRESETNEQADTAMATAAAPTWEWDRTADTPDELEVGDMVRFSKRLTDADIAAFAAASGDTNRLHLDDEFAETTRFGGRIVHGTLVAGLISAALARLPGLTIYLSQDVRFLKPVEPDTLLTAVVEVLEELGDGRYRLSTSVHDDQDRTVIEGEAVVLIDDVADDQPTVLEQPTRER